MATDIKELAISYWRMEKWLNNTNVERKMAANSALRSIKRYLEGNKIEVLDLVGQHFDSGLAVDVINNDVPEGTDDSKIIISETIKPIIMQEGAVIQFGQVSIGTAVKPVVSNEEKSNVDNAAKNSCQSDMTRKIIELSNMIKAQSNSKSKLVGPIVTALLIVILCIQSMLLFKVNNNINNNINNDIQTQQAVGEKENGEQSGNQNSEQTIEQISDQTVDVSVAQQNINVPTDDKSNEIKFVEYEIKHGDSLLSICNEMGISYNSSIEYIKNINGISDVDKIFVGQKILLPDNNKEEK